MGLPSVDDLFGDQPNTPPSADDLFPDPPSDNRPIGTPRPILPQSEVNLTPPSFMDTVNMGIDAAHPEAVKSVLSAAGNVALQGGLGVAGGMAGTALGIGPIAGAGIGSIAGDAIRRYFAGEPVADAVSVPNLARAAIYSTVGMGVPKAVGALPGIGSALAAVQKATPIWAQDAAKFATTLPAIDALENTLGGRPATEGITPERVALEASPAALPPLMQFGAAGARAAGRGIGNLVSAVRGDPSDPRGIVARLSSIGGASVADDAVKGVPIDDYIDMLSPRQTGLRRSRAGASLMMTPEIQQRQTRLRSMYENLAAAGEEDRWAGWRRWGTAPASTLKYGSLRTDEAAQALGENIKRAGMYNRRIGENFGSAAEAVMGRLSLADQLEVRALVEDPSLIPTAAPHLQDAANRMVRVLDKAFDVMSEAGVMVQRPDKLEPVAKLPAYWPRRFKVPEADVPELVDLMNKHGVSQEEALKMMLNPPRPSIGEFVQHQRKPIAMANMPDRLSPLEEVRQYVAEMSKQSGLAYAGGGNLVNGVGDDFFRLSGLIGDQRKAAEAVNFLKDTYKRTPKDFAELSDARKYISRVNMPLAWARQPGQLSMAPSLYGGRNMLRGSLLRSRDPLVGELTALSGAGEAGLSSTTNALLGLDTESVPISWLRNMEYQLRDKVGAPTGYAKLMELADAVGAGTRNAAMEREAYELGTSLDDIAQHLSWGGGKLDPYISRSLIMDSMQRASDNAFLQTTMGELPRAFENPAAQFVLQYRPFGAGQTIAVKNHIGNVIRDGISVARQTGDTSLLKLGLTRAARLGVYSAPTNAGASVLYSTLAGRGLPDATTVGRDVLGGSLGIGGDWVSSLLGLSGHGSVADTMATIPGIETVGNLSGEAWKSAENTLSGDYDAAMLGALRLGMTLAAGTDPTGLTALVNKPLSGWLGSARRAAEDNNRESLSY
jgi:hypothetical protein